MPKVPTVKLNNNIEIPQLGFGTWKLKPVFNEAQNAVNWALETGYRHIDTAHIYLNERSVGKAIKSSGIARKDLFIVTKLWNGDHKDVNAAFEKSLSKLGLDYVDLYLMHYPVSGTRVQAWKDMEQLYKDGRTRAIGVSNFTVTHLNELLAKSKIVPAVNQVEFHPFLYQKELSKYCHEKGIALEAYSPLAHAHNLDNELLNEIGNKYSKSVAQIMIRWSIQHGNIVIPKSKSKERIVENFDVFDFEISKADMVKLDSLNINLRTCWDPSNTP